MRTEDNRRQEILTKFWKLEKSRHAATDNIPEKGKNLRLRKGWKVEERAELVENLGKVQVVYQMPSPQAIALPLTPQTTLQRVSGSSPFK